MWRISGKRNLVCGTIGAQIKCIKVSRVHGAGNLVNFITYPHYKVAIRI